MDIDRHHEERLLQSLSVTSILQHWLQWCVVSGSARFLRRLNAVVSSFSPVAKLVKRPEAAAALGVRITSIAFARSWPTSAFGAGEKAYTSTLASLAFRALVQLVRLQSRVEDSYRLERTGPASSCFPSCRIWRSW